MGTMLSVKLQGFYCGLGSQYFENLYPEAFKVTDYTVGLLNRGFSGRMYLDGLECPCGKRHDIFDWN